MWIIEIPASHLEPEIPFVLVFHEIPFTNYKFSRISWPIRTYRISLLLSKFLCDWSKIRNSGRELAVRETMWWKAEVSNFTIFLFYVNMTFGLKIDFGLFFLTMIEIADKERQTIFLHNFIIEIMVITNRLKNVTIFIMPK